MESAAFGGDDVAAVERRSCVRRSRRHLRMRTFPGRGPKLEAASTRWTHRGRRCRSRATTTTCPTVRWMASANHRVDRIEQASCGGPLVSQECVLFRSSDVPPGTSPEHEGHSACAFCCGIRSPLVRGSTELADTRRC